MVCATVAEAAERIVYRRFTPVNVGRLAIGFARPFTDIWAS